MKKTGGIRSAHIIFALIIIAYTFLVFVTPKLSDDFYYEREFLGPAPGAATFDRQQLCDDFRNCKGDKIETLSQAFNSIKNHYLYWNNGRLATLLNFLVNTLPKGMIVLLQVLFYAIMQALALHYIDARWTRKPLLCVAVVWSWFLLLPWNAHMMAYNYLMNYVWSTAINLLFLYCLSSSRLQAAALLALPAGYMHEGFSVPVSAALVAVALFKKMNKQDIKKYALPCIIYFIATTLLMTTTNIMHRYDEQTISTPGAEFQLYSFIRQFMTDVPLIPITIFIVLVFRPWRYKKFDCRAVFLLTCGLASIAVGLIAHQLGRAIYPSVVALGIFNWQIVASSKLGNKIFATANRTMQFLSATAAILFLGWLSTMVYYQQLGNKEFKMLEQKMLTQPDGLSIIYADIYYPGDMPWYLDNIPGFFGTQDVHVRRQFYQGMAHRSDSAFAVMPERFAKLPLTSLPKIAGNNSLRGEFPTFWSPYRVDPEKFDVTITYGLPRDDSKSYSPYNKLMHKLLYRKGTRIYRNPKIRELGIPVSPTMRKRYKTDADTLWFYRYENMLAIDWGSPIVRIDYTPVK